MPLTSDLRLAHCAKDPVGAFIGPSFDFKAAHTQIQVAPEEHGLLLFAYQGTLYHYRVCHFGGRFSAYWWQRFAALLMRLLHGLLSFAPHRAWLYVDDLFAELHRPSPPEQLAVTRAQSSANVLWPSEALGSLCPHGWKVALEDCRTYNVEFFPRKHCEGFFR